jgi:hypothetical protein
MFIKPVALSGVPASNAFGVETSGDVIEIVLEPFPNECRMLFTTTTEVKGLASCLRQHNVSFAIIYEFYSVEV